MSFGSEAVNCTVPDSGIVPFKADPDIAGKGVITAFLLPAWVSFLLAALTHLAARYASPAEQSSSRGETIHSPLHHRLNLASHRALLSVEILREAVVMFSDQQLVVGTATQLVGFLRHRETSQYHLTIVYYLATIASNTHQVCLLAVQDRLLEHAGMRIWRLVWMLLLDLLLVPTSILVYGSSWLSAYGLSTDCGWRTFGRINSKQDMGLLVLNLAFNAVSITYIMSLLVPVRLWKKALPLRQASQLWQALVRTVANCFNSTNGRLSWTLSERSRNPQASLSGTRRLTTMKALFLAAALNLERSLLVMVFLAWKTVRSDILQLARVLIALTMFTIWLSKIRRDAPYQGLEEGEKSWGFGQILPLLLVSLPAFAIFDAASKLAGESAAEPHGVKMLSEHQSYPTDMTQCTNPRSMGHRLGLRSESKRQTTTTEQDIGAPLEASRPVCRPEDEASRATLWPLGPSGSFDAFTSFRKSCYQSAAFRIGIVLSRLSILVVIVYLALVWGIF